MLFGCLKCDPLSVVQVYADPDLDGQQVAVHGVVYFGEGCEEDEFLLLPKEGPFDGVGPIPMPDYLDRGKCLLIDEDNLFSKLGGSSVSGSYRFKSDAIVVGQIRRQSDSRHPIVISNLWLVLMQDWENLGLGWTNHSMRVILFSPDRLPLTPWNGFQGKRNAYPIIRLDH